MQKDLQNGLIPSFVVATLGTTGICAYDDIKSITEACRNFEEKNRPIWVHVDSAYAGSMLVLPEERKNYLDGVENVDSFNTNLSKCGTGGFDSSPMWVKNRTNLTNSFVEKPDYLQQHERNGSFY